MDTVAPFTLSAKHIESFKKIAGEQFVFVDEESLQHYSHDETENLYYLPEVVIKPRTAEEISAILIICNKEKIPVTPRGAGTGLSGGALPPPLPPGTFTRPFGKLSRRHTLRPHDTQCRGGGGRRG